MMTIAWMLYSLVIGALACVAALAGEHVLGYWQGPRRVVWIIAMLVTAGVPWAVSHRVTFRPGVTAGRRRAEQRASLVLRGTTLSRQRLAQAWIAKKTFRFDRSARALWYAASAITALLWLIGGVRLARERGAWTETKLSGHRVLVADDVGPALVGFVRPRIVIPRWALELHGLERRFLLDHELEHLGADDPRLLLVAVLLLVVFPWNAALWWMLHRLRLAIEIDCDTRVVQTCGAPREYGLFLLAVGERRTRSLPLAASLAERRSLLERRIHAMTSQRPRYPLLASIPLAAIVLGAATLAAQTPQPPAGAMIARTRVAPNRVELTAAQVRSVVAAHHPDLVAGTTDDNTLTIIISSSGDYVASGSSHAAAGGTVFLAAPTARLDSAERANIERTAAQNAKSEGGVVLARATAGFKSEEGGPQPMMQLAGIGQVDPSLVRDMYWLTFSAGEVAAHDIRVRVVTVAGSATK